MTTVSIEPPPISELKKRFDIFAEEFFDRLRADWPRENGDKQRSDAPDTVWPKTLFGEVLTGCNESWATDLLAGNVEAVALTGHWLLVEAADANQFPNLLRPLGESYYRWRTQSRQNEKELEKTLIQILNDKAATLKLRNSIEPVAPGDRFDANRHNPLPGQRGVTVDDVFGWIVMRDDRVFAKATVSLK